MAFTDFPEIEKTPQEVNQRGINQLFEILNMADPITRAFNALSERDKKLLIAIGGASESDLSNPYHSNFRLENYSDDGFKKIVKAIRYIRRLAEKLPCESALETYTSSKQLKQRELRNEKHHSN